MTRKNPPKVKNPKTSVNVNNDKQASSIVDAEEWKNKTPIWSFSSYDRNLPRNEWCFVTALPKKKLITRLIDFEGMTWDNILKATHGKDGKSKNHTIPLSGLKSLARQRCEELNYEEIFSLRLTNVERLIGIRVGRVFNVLWYDPNHEVTLTKYDHK